MAQSSLLSRFFRRNVPQVARFGVLILLVLLTVGAVVVFTEVMLPFVLAALLAYLLAPLVDGLCRLKVRGWGLHRGLAIVAIYAVFFSGMFLAGRFIMPSMGAELNRFVRELPRMLVRIEHDWVLPAEVEINAWLAEFAPPPLDEALLEPGVAANGAVLEPTAPQTPTPLRDPAVAPWRALVEEYTYVVRPMDGGRFEVVPRRRQVGKQEAEPPERMSPQLTGAFRDIRERIENNFFELIEVGRKQLAQVVNSFFMTFLVFMIAAFILVAPHRIQGFLRELVPPAYQQKFDDLLQQLDRGLSGVVRGQLTICLINGFFTGIGLFALGVPFAITLTAIATVLSLVPIFGVLLSSIPITVMALSVSFPTALAMVIWIAAIHFLEGNFLNPKIMGDAARIHPALVIFALLVGQYSAGVIGALIAVPIFSVVQSSFLYLKNLAESWEQTA